jgi:hypothetical protein
MPNWICSTCCAEFPPSDTPPETCPICSDPRQYVLPRGQRWTTKAELVADGHRTEIREEEPGLYGIGVTPKAGIGQRALLVAHDEGGVLFDGVPLIDDEGLAEIARLGGVRAIVASHPHLYGAIITNARKLGNVPVYLPEADRQWLMNPDPLVTFFSGDRLDLGHGITLHVTGGHFDGSAFLFWPDGAGGKGAILTGDTMLVTPGQDWVSFMWSSPNLVQLNPGAIRKIVAAAEVLDYDRIYAGWWDAKIPAGAKARVAASEARIRQMQARG